MDRETASPTNERSGDPAPLTRGNAGSVGISSIVAGVSGLVVMVIAARALKLEDNAEFLLFWSLLFWIFGILGGIQHETVRSVRSGYSAPDSDVKSAVPVLRAATGIGAVFCGIIIVTSFLWAPQVFRDAPVASGVIIAVAAFLFSGHSSIVGALSGRGEWNSTAVVISAEALTRMAIVLLVIILGVAGVLSLEIAAASGCLVWLVAILVSSKVRSAAGARGDVTTREFVVMSTKSMVAAGASSTLLVGFPTLLAITSPGSVYHDSAALIFALSMTRAPLLMPLAAFQGVVIAHFVSSPKSGFRIVAFGSAAILAFGAAIGALAMYFGPALLELVNPEYRVDGVVLAGLTMCAAMLALVTLTGTLTLATKQHTIYLAGWVAATVIAIAILCLPWNIETRVIVSLISGPALGALIHCVGIVRAARRATQSRNAMADTKETD